MQEPKQLKIICHESYHIVVKLVAYSQHFILSTSLKMEEHVLDTNAGKQLCLAASDI